MHRLSVLRAALSVALLANLAQADLKPNALFTDHAVLQQGQPLPVWGTADAGAEVSVAFPASGQSVDQGRRLGKVDGQAARTKRRVGLMN